MSVKTKRPSFSNFHLLESTKTLTTQNTRQQISIPASVQILFRHRCSFGPRQRASSGILASSGGQRLEGDWAKRSPKRLARWFWKTKNSRGLTRFVMCCFKEKTCFMFCTPNTTFFDLLWSLNHQELAPPVAVSSQVPLDDEVKEQQRDFRTKSHAWGKPPTNYRSDNWYVAPWAASSRWKRIGGDLESKPG